MRGYGRKGRSGGKSKLRGRLLGLAVLVCIGLAAWLLISMHTVRGGLNALIEEDWDGAQARIERGRSLRLLHGGVAEVAGLLELARGRVPQAEQYFAEADAGWLRLSGLGGKWPVFLRWHLSEHGNYEGMEVLCRYLDRRGIEDEELSLLHGCALCGLHRLEEAKRVLAPLDRPGISPHKEEARRLLDLIDEQQRRGRFVSVLDRGGIPLVELDLESGRLAGIEESAESLVGTGEEECCGLELDLTPGERNNVNVLTIDGDLQRAAHQALDGQRGAIVVIDPLTGDLLAVAANGDGRGLQTALVREFEPASVIKLITLAAALREGPVERFDLFPFTCRGNMAVEGRAFYDWRAHGRIPHVEHAMAVSCNLVFARLGQLLGTARVVEELERFGFDGEITRDESTIMSMNLGQIRGNPKSTWELSRLAVGLDHLVTTPLHLALIASAIANQGVMMKPRLLLRRENILGQAVTGTEPEPMAEVIDPAVAAALTDAMFEVVESSEGTGRRAAIDGLDLALKTGTGGDRKLGLDGIVVGFAPAHQPRVAFCVVLEGAGKAELAAARATRQLLEAVLYKLELLRDG